VDGVVVKRNIAIIPARGGSKRVPRKNIIDFFGKPLIAWTIEAALQSNVFDCVIVSTDSEEIAEVSRRFGAQVPFLRDAFADDFSTVQQATLYALDKIENLFQEQYKHVTMLGANCPIRRASTISSAYDNFIIKKNVFQISCFEFGWQNPWWACKLKSDSSPQFIFPEGVKSRSQDLEKLYCPTGAVWIADTEALRLKGTFYGDPLTIFPLDWKAAVDIDTFEDLEFAKAAFLIENSSQNSDCQQQEAP
jgi:CMP-N-acetylneuraminic acid synthetase